MAIVFQDGFDHYGDDGSAPTRFLQGLGWSEVAASGGPVFSDSANPIGPRTGVGYLIQPNSSGSTENRLVLPSTYTDLFISFAFLCNSLPDGDGTHRIWIIADSSNNTLFTVFLQANGGIRLLGGAVDTTTGANTITPNEWHAITVRLAKSATLGRVQLYVNDTLLVDLSNQNTGATAIGILRTLVSGAGTDFTHMSYDDLVIYDTSGARNNSYLGDLKVATLVPRADDPDIADWTPNTRHRYGNGVFFCDGDADGFTAADNTAFEFGTGDFTMETWVHFLGLPSGSNAATFFGKWRESTNERSCRLYLGGPTLNDGHLQFECSTGGTAGTVAVVASAEWTPEIGKWYHVAVQRASGETVMFVDGVPLNAPAANAHSFHDNASLFVVGGLQNGTSTLIVNYSVNGYLEEVRVTKGVARYNQTGFAVPTDAFPRSVVAGDAAFADVSLLCGFDTTLADESSFGRALTARGAAGRYAPDDAQPGDFKTVRSTTPRDDTYMEAPYTPATNVLTFSGQPSNGDTVEVDGTTYTFNTVLGGADSILIGGSVDASIDNLVAAINGDTGEGTIYGTGTTVSTNAFALNIDNNQMRVTADTPGTAGNAISADESGANLAWADTGGFLVGGLNIPDPSAFFLTRLPAQTTGVRAVTLLARARKTDTGDGKLQMALVTADDSSANGIEHALSTSTAYKADIIETDPSTMAGLTPSTFVGARFRIDRTE